MTRPSYKQALDDVLLPLGFEGRSALGYGKREKLWTRIRDGFREDVSLQYSQFGGFTANFLATDLETERIWVAATGTVQQPRAFTRISAAAGESRDRWFKNNANGALELAQMVSDHVEPFMNSVRSLEDQASKWYRRGPPPQGNYATLIALAITLYRMGEFEEAMTALNPPPRRTAIKSWLEILARAKAWLEPKIDEAMAETKA